MPDAVTPERVAAIAAAARVPLAPASAARVAQSTTAAVARFSEGPVGYPFEAEPASYVLVSSRDAAR